MKVQAGKSASVSELMAQKQSAGVRKFEGLRDLSDAQRSALNDQAGDICLQIASQFGKSKRYVPSARA